VRAAAEGQGVDGRPDVGEDGVVELGTDEIGELAQETGLVAEPAGMARAREGSWLAPDPGVSSR
jgi:hypothetical protein